MSERADIALVYPARSLSRVSLEYNFGSAHVIGYLRQNGYIADSIVLDELDEASFVDRLLDLRPRAQPSPHFYLIISER